MNWVVEALAVDNVNPCVFYKAHAQCCDILAMLRPDGDPQVWLLPGMPTGGLNRNDATGSGDGDSGTSGSGSDYSDEYSSYDSEDDDDGLLYDVDVDGDSGDTATP